MKFDVAGFVLWFLVITEFVTLCYAPLITTTASVAGALGLSALYAGWGLLKCKWQECCSDPWIYPNMTGLDIALTKQLHGQHLVRQTVMRALKGHLRNKKSRKPLVLSFHGWTGGGKNFVSRLIAEHLYTLGTKSEYVKTYISTNDFPHSENVKEYKKRLKEEIPKLVKECPNAFFIFDEMDKMPPGVIDAIKPFLDYHENVDGVDYRRAIFIFLSNTGGTNITKVAFQFWADGKEREEITMKDVESLINKGAFNEKGGLYRSDVIQKHLIDIYVPFLPLEKEHIKLCVRDRLIEIGHHPDKKLIHQVTEQMEYFPEDIQLFSVTGCKRVTNKVDLGLIYE